MANFLGNIGAALQGQQNYQTYLDQREAAKLRLQADKTNLASIQDLADQAKKQRDRDPDVAQGLLDLLSGTGEGIPPPPGQQPQAPQAPQAPQGAPSPQQTPAPGQPSVPMQQAQYGQRPIPGSPPPMPPQMPPQAQMPQGLQQAQQRPPGPPQGPPQGQQGPQGQPSMPPYQTVGGRPMPPQQPMGIPAPPQQQPGAPAPNSMTLQDAAKLIKSRGIKDPVTSLQILEKLTPYLNNEAKQEAAQLKMQLDQQNKLSALQEKYDAFKTASEDKNRGIEERAKAAENANQTKNVLGQLNANIRQQNTNLRAQAIKEKVASGGTLGKDDYDLMADQALAGDRSVFTGLGRSPKDMAGLRSAITRKAKEQGISGKDLASITAEFKGLEAGERTLGQKTAQVGLAANEARSFATNALAASEKVDRTRFPDLNKVILAGEQKSGDPDVVAFGSYNNSLVNAYARAVSPTGAPTVSDKDHAREILTTAYSKGQYKAAVDVILKEIDAAKASPTQTKQELRDLATGGKSATPPGIPAGWSVKVQ